MKYIFEKNYYKLFLEDHAPVGGNIYDCNPGHWSLFGFKKWKMNLPFGTQYIPTNCTINQIVPSLIYLAKKLDMVLEKIPESHSFSNKGYAGPDFDCAIITKGKIKTNNKNVLFSENCPENINLIIPVSLNNNKEIEPEFTGVLVCDNSMKYMFKEKIYKKKKDKELFESKYGLMLDVIPMIVINK